MWSSRLLENDRLNLIVLERQLHLYEHSYYSSNNLSCITALICHDAGDDFDDKDDHHHHDDDDARFLGDQGASRLVDCVSHQYTQISRKSVWPNQCC